MQVFKSVSLRKRLTKAGKRLRKFYKPNATEGRTGINKIIPCLRSIISYIRSSQNITAKQKSHRK